MHSGTVRKQEVEMPFIAEIVMALISLGATFLYFRDLLLPMGALVVIGVVVLRRNAWAISAAILMSLAVELYNRQREVELRIVVMLLLAGISLQLLAAFWERRRLGYWGSSFTENAVFAIIGYMIGYAIQFRVCQPAAPEFDVTGIVYLWYSLVGCTVVTAVQPVAAVMAETEAASPLLVTALGLFCLRAFVMSPPLWGIVMAGFRASGLAIWKPGRVLGHIVRAFFGSSVAGFPGLAIILGLIALDFALTSEGITAYSGFINLALLITMILSTIIGAAWGAGRGG